MTRSRVRRASQHPALSSFNRPCRRIHPFAPNKPGWPPEAGYPIVPENAESAGVLNRIGRPPDHACRGPGMRERSSPVAQAVTGSARPQPGCRAHRFGGDSSPPVGAPIQRSLRADGVEPRRHPFLRSSLNAADRAVKAMLPRSPIRARERPNIAERQHPIRPATKPRSAGVCSGQAPGWPPPHSYLNRE